VYAQLVARPRDLRSLAELRADLQRAYDLACADLARSPRDPLLIWQRNVLAARLLQIDSELDSR
jgi:hypothetical protein